jgi:hypothetical protein
MRADGPEAKRSRNACPFCGAHLKVGFGDFLPTKGRAGPVRMTCRGCRGQVRLASSTQVAGVLGMIAGLLAGAIVGARLAAASEQSTLVVLAGAIGGGFFLSFVTGYAFLRLDPDGAPPAHERPRGKRSKRGKK